MKYLLTSIIILTCCTVLPAQSKDAAYYDRVDERVEAMMHHFRANVSSDPAITDTVAYTQRVFANHLETIKLRTSIEKNRKPMYNYAIDLRNKNLAAVLTKDDLNKYFDSFQGELKGFSFCSVCAIIRSGNNKACGNCGTAY